MRTYLVGALLVMILLAGAVKVVAGDYSGQPTPPPTSDAVVKASHESQDSAFFVLCRTRTVWPV